MSNGMRRALLAAGVLALVLFAGRWTATTLADRWWGLAVSPAAAQFLTDVNLLRLTLDLAGVVIATAWFTGNLLVVYRAIGGVERPAPDHGELLIARLRLPGISGA